MESEKHRVSGIDWMATRMADITDRIEWQDMLDSLPEKLRDIVIQHYWHGLNSREIAQLLKIPDATVRARLRAAIKMLRVTAN